MPPIRPLLGTQPTGTRGSLAMACIVMDAEDIALLRNVLDGE
ncbi:hypothetical protein [Streptomyces prunicolor]|uniref:Uncharacterized protein n=1 Tax=Streptomyces prunicolor TaxID=67348 RepID=A0ABU4F964_9ACTN|nr:hypothetical protein [Streptomyces prunicolor]MCX5234981.1 hypothetical protein [Streptomyces prunicolor]MDV7216516.1 hypothetical protein [Streptomyces prunicolor]